VITSKNEDIPKYDQDDKQHRQVHYNNNLLLIDTIWLQEKDNLFNLQEKIENYAFQSAMKKSIPILEFDTDAQNILSNALKHGRKNENDEIQIYRFLAAKSHDGNINIYSLFQQHIQNLREYYGCGYESILDDYLEKIDLDDNDGYDRAQREGIWTEAARSATEGFRTAANHAIPKLCNDIQELYILYASYVTCELEGLIRDLMEATEMRQPFDEDEDNDDDDNGMTQPPKRPKWYKKLAARALALGVNYLQGWLALQGLRKAALERDQLIPKFPIF